MAVSDLRVQPRHLKIVSLNMHGFNQDFTAINEMIKSLNPDVFFCQEHWLTPANLHTNFMIIITVTFLLDLVQCQTKLKLIFLEDSLLVAL